MIVLTFISVLIVYLFLLLFFDLFLVLKNVGLFHQFFIFIFINLSVIIR
jgi:hypothetical protein